MIIREGGGGGSGGRWGGRERGREGERERDKAHYYDVSVTGESDAGRRVVKSQDIGRRDPRSLRNLLPLTALKKKA
jgi:hypothetical protein